MCEVIAPVLCQSDIGGSSYAAELYMNKSVRTGWNKCFNMYVHAMMQCQGVGLAVGKLNMHGFVLLHSITCIAMAESDDVIRLELQCVYICFSFTVTCLQVHTF